MQPIKKKIYCPHCKTDISENRLLQMVYSGDVTGNHIDILCENCECDIECTVVPVPVFEGTNSQNSMIFES